MPFEIPESWKWVTLGDISNYGQTKHTDVLKIPEEDWVLELEDIEKDSGRLIQTLSRKDRKISGVRCEIECGQILYSKLRTYLNKVLIAPKKGFCTTEIIPFYCFGEINHYYITSVLRSQYFIDYTTLCCYGCKMPRLSTDDARKGMIPLPPIAEQKRIVLTIKHLFLLIDSIDASKNDLQEAVDRCKTKVLDLAIHGKLVSQDSNDEPAVELLKRINPNAPICDTSHYGNLPKGWCATTFEYLSTNIASKKYQIKQSEINESGKYPVISQSANFIEGYSDANSKLLHIPSPIIVFGDHTRITKYIDFDFIVGADGVKILQPLISAKYFYYLTQYVAKKIENRGYSRHYSYLSRYIVPLPPRVEQERIALRIEELFDVLDKISADL